MYKSNKLIPHLKTKHAKEHMQKQQYKQTLVGLTDLPVAAIVSWLFNTWSGTHNF